MHTERAETEVAAAQTWGAADVQSLVVGPGRGSGGEAAQALDAGVDSGLGVAVGLVLDVADVQAWKVGIERIMGAVHVQASDVGVEQGEEGVLAWDVVNGMGFDGVVEMGAFVAEADQA